MDNSRRRAPSPSCGGPAARTWPGAARGTPPRRTMTLWMPSTSPTTPPPSTTPTPARRPPSGCEASCATCSRERSRPRSCSRTCSSPLTSSSRSTLTKRGVRSSRIGL
ncbi:uncharacterized protein DKFZp434B061-like isoform X2 [Penaeus indicus]|uniref:uncharacterized protein DKFZp434B061-like isoform X2 n=1 Tax=Penaeus indicus TaxID=29960 RepID=UPI00300C04FF